MPYRRARTVFTAASTTALFVARLAATATALPISVQRF